MLSQKTIGRKWLVKTYSHLTLSLLSCDYIIAGSSKCLFLILVAPCARSGYQELNLHFLILV